MKKFLIGFVFLFLLSGDVFASQISQSCTYNGVPLYGRVKVVNSFPDFKVKRVTSYADLKVKEVTSFANSCGRWQFVDSFPDFTIKYVDSFEDFKIKFVNSSEGL